MEFVKDLQSGSGKRFCVKLFRKKNGAALRMFVGKKATSEKDEARLCDEIKTLKLLQNRNVPRIQKLVCCRRDPLNKLCMYTRYYEEGDLLDFVISTEGNILPLQTLLLIFVDVGKALSGMHRAGVCHFDVKPENIFLSQEEGRLTATLADLELAGKAMTRKARGTEKYWPPEMLSLHKKIVDTVDGRACDVFSFAHTILLLCDQPSVAPRLQPAVEGFFTKKCCCPEPEARPSTDEVLLVLKETLNPFPVVVAGARCPPSLQRKLCMPPEPDQSVTRIFEALSLQTKTGSP